jgi:Prealbumin-like fold domain
MMKLFFISVLIVILIASIIEANFFSLSNAVRLSYNFLPLSYSQQEQEIIKEQKVISNKSNQNKTSAAAINNNKVQGTLIVTTKVNNEDGGSSKPSDFIIKVHGNKPSISSFPGNSSGTIVKLDMGMYSITESGPSNYNSSYSMDCSGAVMSVKTIKCEIINTYIKPIAGNNSIQ